VAALDGPAVHAFLAALPAVTLSVQWGDDHIYKVGGKMFAAMRPPGHTAATVSFKASDDSFIILTAIPGITPAPYLARAKWVRLDRLSLLKPAELMAYLERSHAIIAAGLAKKARRDLGLDP
jgi:predicted DNA-binding protein (MmcQ/YjbR family)